MSPSPAAQRQSHGLPGSSRRVLLVAYHFGPGCATGGIRWNAMTADLASRGWEFDVLTLARPLPGGSPDESHAAYSIGERIRVYPVTRPSWQDDAFEAAVRFKRWLQRGRGKEAKPSVQRELGPEDVKAWTATEERSRYTRLMANVNAARATVGDLAWSGRALRVARRLANARGYLAVIVSSPPHVTHRVGIGLSEELGLPFLPDFRDPWTFGLADGFLASGFERWLGHLMERSIFEEARLVICNTDWSRRAVERVEVGRAVRAVTVPNGFDPIGPAATPDAGLFRVAFSGWLYPYMDPRPLLAACGRLRGRAVLGPETLRVEFMGTEDTFGSVPLAALADSYGLRGCFVLHPKAERADALRLQQSAAVLVAFDYPHPLAVPMKFYDQAQMRGSMLLIGNPRGALADAANQLKIRVYAPGDAAGIDAALDRALDRWRQRDFSGPLDPGGIFNRRHATDRMEQVLKAIAESGPAPEPTGGSAAG